MPEQVPPGSAPAACTHVRSRFSISGVLPPGFSRKERWLAWFAWIRLDISDFPTRHNYGLAPWQSHIERILAGWVDELGVPTYGGREVTGFAQDATGVA